MNTTDKGLKKALSQQPDYRLPSNFSYRMMQKIHQETLLREKRQEKRLFILMLVTTFLAIGGCLVLLCWQYGNKLLSLLHILQEGSPSLQTCLFYLPILCALFLLFLFNRWLRKNSSHTLKEAVPKQVSQLKIVFTHTQKENPPVSVFHLMKTTHRRILYVMTYSVSLFFFKKQPESYCR